MGSSVEVRLLGPVEVAVDGVPTDLGGVRQRLLVARLGLAVGRVVPTADLLELLWPEEIPDSAVANLQSYVSRVRGRIGRDLIVKDPGGYRLVLDRADVDATRVEDDLARLVQLEPRVRLETLDAARRAWRGASLADLVDWLGLVPHAVRLDELRLRVVELWAEAVLGNGQCDVCLTVLTPFVDRHPTRENLHLAYMRALAGTGRVDEALRVANELRTAIGEASGLVPGERLVELEQRLLAGPHVALGSPVAGRIDRPPSNTFVGRHDELRELVDQADRPGVVEVVGPAGVGKTRLVLECLSRSPWSSSRPTRFVDLTGCSPSDPVHAVVAGALSIGVAGGDVVEMISDALDPRALLVLDNCEQVADGVASLVQGVSALRDDVTLICTSRRRLGVEGVSQHLTPLSSADAVALFEDRARAHRRGFSVPDDSSDQLAAIVSATDGLPLALEILSARERVLGLDELARHVRLVDVGHSVDDLAPELLANLESSYRLLSDGARALYRKVSVIPGSFGLSLVEALDDQPVTNLGELVDVCLVTVDHGSEVRYRLLYPVRTVGLQYLQPEEAVTAYAAVSDWVLRSLTGVRQAQNERRPGPTAFLRREGPIISSCINWLVEAGRSTEAARLAVDVSLILTDEPSTDWLARLGQLADDARRRSDPPDEADGLWVLAGASAAWIGGDIERCRDLLVRAQSALRDDHPLGWYVSFVEATAAVYRADPSSAERCARLVLSNVRAPEFIRATAVCAAALAHGYADRFDRAAELMAIEPELLADVGRIDGFVDFTRAELCRHDDPVRAAVLLRNARDLCAAAGHTYNHRVASIAQLALDVRQRNLDEARNLAVEVVTDCGRSGMWPQAWITARLAAELLAADGRSVEAEVLFRLADIDRLAPAVSGEDAARMVELRSEIERKLTEAEHLDVDRLVAEIGRSGLADFVAGALHG